MKKICIRCKGEFEEDFFPYKNKKKGIRIGICFNCKREYDRNYWQKIKDVKGNEKNKKAKILKDRNKAFVCDYLKKHPCLDCGEKDIVVLEFDHQRDKKFNISAGINHGYSIKKIKAEIDKCEVVCANCHRRRTTKQFNHYKNNYIDL